MKLRSFAAIIFAFVFCLSAGLCLLTALNVKGETANGLYIMTMHRENAFFNLNNITYLERERYSFTFTDRQYLQATSGINEDEVEVIATNENFAQMACLNIITGSFFNEMHVSKRSNVVVLSSAAAWRFYGGKQCIGNFLYINNEAYKVIGIFKNDLSNKDKMLLYIPFNSLKGFIPQNPNISDVWLNLHDISEAGLVIKMLGYSADDVRIIHMEQYKDITLQRFRIIVFLVGIVIIVYLWKRILGEMKIIRREFAVFLRENYISDIWSVFKRRNFLYPLLLSILYMLAVLLILKLILFKMCIPHCDFKLGHLDFAALSSILHFYLQPYIGVPALEYVNDLNMMSHVFFIVSLLTGITFVYFIRIMRLENIKRVPK